MEGNIIKIWIMGSICDKCHEAKPEVCVVKETKYGQSPSWICVECSLEFKIGETK